MLLTLTLPLGCTGDDSTASASTGASAGPSSSGDGSLSESSTGISSSGSSTADATTTTTAATATTSTTSDSSSTTGEATTETGTSASGGMTTGSSDCESIVGVTECEALAAFSDDLTLETCQLCQGIACGQEPSCDQEFPCVDGAILLRGCCTDRECSDISPFCGMFTGVNNLCVLDDDV